MLERLLQRLNKVFNVDPQSVNVVSVVSETQPCSATIASCKLQLVAGGQPSVEIDFSALTVSQLVTAIGLVPGFSATVLISDYSGMLARGLVEGTQDLTTDANLKYPTSLLYSEFQVAAGALDEQDEHRKSADRQLYANTAEADWLDLWMSGYFAVPRILTESDADYFKRAAVEVFGLKVNNKALMKMIADAVDYFVDVRDMGEALENCLYSNSYNGLSNGTDLTSTIIDLSTAINLNGIIGVYIYNGNINYLNARDKTAIINIINRYKAAGKAVKYFAPSNMLISNDPVTVLNNVGYVSGPISGWAEVTV